MIQIKTLVKSGVWMMLAWILVLPTAIVMAQESEQTFDPVVSILHDRYNEVMDRLSDGRLNPNLVINEWFGLTVMHLVAPARLDFLRMAVEKGGDCDATDNFNETPLHFAASQGLGGPGPASIRVLIECGADVNAQNSRGKTPLHAVYSGAFGREPYGPDFANFANLGFGHKRLDIVEALLNSGADPNFKDNNQDALLSVIFKSKMGFFSKHVRLMLDGGADPNLRDANGDTPLFFAAMDHYDLEEETEILLTGGADPCLRNRNGKLPYELAKKAPKVEKLLYEAGGYFDKDLGMCARDARVLVEKENDLNLSRNDRKRIQSCLKGQGFDPGTPDGVFGPRTRKALQDWQMSEGFTGAESVAYLTASQAESLLEACKEVVQSEPEEVIETTVEKTESVSAPKPVQAARRSVGERFSDCSGCPEMVVVPAGSFMMGAPRSEEGRKDSEGPVHRVTIPEPFAVGRYEVTFREWDACVSGGGCSHRPDDEGWGRGNRPVVRVSWEDAKEYVAWLSRKTGERYRLLSDSEWEYVARAGTTGPFHFGSTISTDQANYIGDFEGVYRGQTVPVGSFPANEFGLHDVHGNVGEWVEDCWHDNYIGAPSDGSAWISGGDCAYRVLRGGSWDNEPWYLRSAFRSGSRTGVRSSYAGFRVARTLAP